ncbi:MAG: hypothetical protein K2W92_01300 [Alphaproteobacteria bacterium]|nr:hypothetical protein [Alphaproteobacteria bacterium]
MNEGDNNMNINKFLISLSTLTCFVFESKAAKEAVKVLPPPANEIEVGPLSIKHKWSSFSAPISQDLLAEDPEIQGPSGIGVECKQALLEYSALFKKSPEGEVFDNPLRITFWLAQHVNNPERWRVVTPSGTRSLIEGDYEERIIPDNIASYYFEDLED